MFDRLKARGFEIEFTSHAQAIIATDFPNAALEIERSLLDLPIPITEIIGSGGGETKATQRLRRSLAAQGWTKTRFTLEKTINGQPRESISHEIDHVRTFAEGVAALEIEWNNKDPFFDRDLENFKRLHAEGGISFGGIITRGSSLQGEIRSLVLRFAIERRLEDFDDVTALGLTPTPRQKAQVASAMKQPRGPSFAEAWTHQFVNDKYGQATTHWRKLEDRIRRGVGNPCPLVLIGLPARIVNFDVDAPVEALDDEGRPATG
jgi:hypothetical protein